MSIEGKIIFDTNRATIRQGSERVLKTLLQFVNEHPEVTLLRVEGHTDDTENPEQAYELSAKRALAVCDWLVDNGVVNTRLLAVASGLPGRSGQTSAPTVDRRTGARSSTSRRSTASPS